jgi:hypothetical protein
MGADLADWQRTIQEDLPAHWRVDDGVIVSDGHEPYLATAREYGDFELWVEWKISPQGDSGIYLRGTPQVQIWDPWNPDGRSSGADRGSGGLWNNETHARFPTVLADKPPGTWNRMHIVMVGAYVTVELNEKRVVDNVVMENYYDRTIPIFARGPIYLQTHGNETRFRNLFIREIGSDEANRRLAEMSDEEGFSSLFPGRDLAGWIGATEDYEVVDGAIQCKAGRHGNLLTADNYENFVVRLEFRLPPGGNNGLAIRTPIPESDPSVSGIELQVLDDTAPQYAELRPDQYHGSAYGLAPAHRGFLRPTGQWNYEEVIVNGDRIEVWLNGFTTLDVNLAEVRQQPLDGLDHPGASRKTGRFGFCGHGDPVAFRNIRIKKI